MILSNIMEKILSKTEIKFIALLAFSVLTCVIFVPVGITQTRAETAGQKFKNIKVLNDIPAEQLGKVMNIMAASLGVNCKMCHISNDKDFEKDDNEHKGIARQMIIMTWDLNKNHFDSKQEVSCSTCHNGRMKPIALPSLIPPVPVERPRQPDIKPTIEQIIDRYAIALGGKAGIAKIVSRDIKANRLEPDGKTIEPEEIYQAAGKLRVKTTYGDYVVTEGYDGRAAWKHGNKNVIELKSDEAEQIRREAQLFANPDLKAVYSKLDFRSVDKIGDREVYLVLATLADNQRERLYFDVQTGLLVRRTASSPTVLGQFQYQVDYGDYKDFGGVKLPATIHFAVPSISWTRKIVGVNNNNNIKDRSFDPMFDLE